MKRIMTLGSLLLMLTFFAVLGAQNHNNNWQGQHPNYNNNDNHHNNNWQSEITEFRGVLVRTGGYSSNSGNVSFNINISEHPSANLYVNNHQPVMGFGIKVSKPNGNSMVYNFDNRGDKLARQLLNRWRHKKNLVVEVKGIINHRTKTIEVVSLKRVTGNHYWQQNSNNNHNHPGWDEDSGPWS